MAGGSYTRRAGGEGGRNRLSLEKFVERAERDKYLATLSIKVLRFCNGRLRREPQVIRDAIFEELQKRAPHPLPEYTRPMVSGEKSAKRVERGGM
jgi:hypothetical protein